MFSYGSIRARGCRRLGGGGWMTVVVGWWWRKVIKGEAGCRELRGRKMMFILLLL
ncbi:hypothetical protein Hanom_Chr16g01494311 [Helianthus anomalus]